MRDNERFYQLIHEYFFEHLANRRKASKHTIASYRQSLNEFRKYMRDQKNTPFLAMDFSSFSRDNVYDFLVYLRDQKHLSAATVNLRMAAIKSFIRYSGDEEPAVTMHYLSLAKIHKFKDPNRSARIEYLTEAQLKILFTLPDTNTKQGRRDQFIMILLYETGARIEEFLNIRLSDILRQGNMVQVRLHGKGDKIRYIPLLDDVIEHLDVYLEAFHSESTEKDFLLYTIHQHCHTQMTEGNVNHLLKKYAALANKYDPLFPCDLHCHTMRHSIAMAMYKKGIPLTYIKDFLGHANMNSVSIYAHADSATISKALERANSDLNVGAISHEKKWQNHEEELLAFCGLE